MDTDDKNVREARVNEWIAAVQEKYEEEHPDMMQYMDEILYKMQKKIVKKWLLAGQPRRRPQDERDPPARLPRSA